MTRRLRRVRVQHDGLLIRPWLRRPLLVPWPRIKGVRVGPADRWSGRGAAPGDVSYYFVEVRLNGEWHRLGRSRRVRNSIRPGHVRTPDEVHLLRTCDMVRSYWEAGGGTPGDEDDNWPAAGGPARRIASSMRHFVFMRSVRPSVR